MKSRVPYAGYAIHALRSEWLQRASLVAIVLFGLLALVRVWTPKREADGETAGDEVAT